MFLFVSFFFGARVVSREMCFFAYRAFFNRIADKTYFRFVKIEAVIACLKNFALRFYVIVITSRKKSKISQWNYDRIGICFCFIQIKWEKISIHFHFIFCVILSISFYSNEKKSRYHSIFPNRIDNFFEISITKFKNF